MAKLTFVVGVLAALAFHAALALPHAQLPSNAVIIGDGALETRDDAAKTSAAKTVQLELASEGVSQALAALALIDDPVEFETAADVLVQSLQLGNDSPDVRAALEVLSALPIRVFKRHEEARTDWFVPVFDVGASARYALRSLRERAQRSDWVNRLARDPDMALASLVDADADARERAAEAISVLDSSVFDQLTASALIQPERVDSTLWRALALRNQSMPVLFAAARYCRDDDLLALIPIAAHLPANDATEWLLTLSSRPQLASLALMTLAPRAAKGSRALDALIAGLDSPQTGSTSAAALASRPHKDRVELIDRLMTDGGATPRRLQSLALALRLEGSSKALVLLERLSRDERLPQTVRAELAR